MGQPSNLPPGVTDDDIERDAEHPLKREYPYMTETECHQLTLMVENNGYGTVLHALAVYLAKDEV